MGGSLLFAALLTFASPALAQNCGTPAPEGPAVGPQYDTTHVYTSAADYDRFMQSLVATFGGRLTPKNTANVAPVPSSTWTQLALTPAGSISAFAFQTPVPWPLGAERTGYLVKDLDQAVAAARAAGASVLVAPFRDPIGRDAVIQWPGGVNMQLYVHDKAPCYAPLATVPENRVYVAPEAIDAFVRGFTAFAKGRLIGDEARAPGEEVGQPGARVRRVRIESGFGKLVAYATNGQLPFPYGREMTGYEVPDLDATLAKAQAAGAELLVGPVTLADRRSAMLRFPGGYIAELHAPR